MSWKHCSEITLTLDYFQEGASDDAMLMLIGNKMDLAEDDTSKVVSMKNGSQLADVKICQNIHWFPN